MIIAALCTFPGIAAQGEDVKPQLLNPLEGRSDVVEDGRSLFSQYCSHCHGQYAVQGERPRDLRRLKLRYGNGAAAVFYETINSGLLDRGMPAWKGVLSDDAMWRIFTFLQTVQTQ
jgi:mono/diheme cytochrome c family protein